MIRYIVPAYLNLQELVLSTNHRSWDSYFLKKDNHFLFLFGSHAKENGEKLCGTILLRRDGSSEGPVSLDVKDPKIDKFEWKRTNHAKYKAHTDLAAWILQEQRKIYQNK